MKRISSKSESECSCYDRSCLLFVPTQNWGRGDYPALWRIIRLGSQIFGPTPIFRPNIQGAILSGLATKYLKAPKCRVKCVPEWSRSSERHLGWTIWPRRSPKAIYHWEEAYKALFFLLGLVASSPLLSTIVDLESWYIEYQRYA
jgi:hypothetical protein